MSGRAKSNSEAYSLDSISGLESFDSRMEASRQAPLIHLGDEDPALSVPVRDVSMSSHDSGLADRELESGDRFETSSGLPPSIPEQDREQSREGVQQRPLASKHRGPSRQGFLPLKSCPDVLRSREAEESARNFERMFGLRLSGRRRPRHPVGRVQSVSERFYDESGEQRSNIRPDLYVSFDEEPRRAQIKQSKKLPGWAWYLLSKSLGVKSHPREKPIFATFLHVLTLTFGLTFLVTYTWHKVYDIVSIMTKSTVLTGMVEIVICICWVSLTIYANKCAARLFSSKNFIRSVRLHSKTIFKVSAVGLMGILGVSFMTVNSYHAVSTFQDEHCLSVNLSFVVCKIVYPARVSFNIFGIIWNMIVAAVLLSVCRTHTVGIRRFIKELEMDGKKYEDFWKERMSGNPTQSLLDLDNLHDLDAMSDGEFGSEWIVWQENHASTPPQDDRAEGVRQRSRCSTGETQHTGEITRSVSQLGHRPDNEAGLTPIVEPLWSTSIPESPGEVGSTQPSVTGPSYPGPVRRSSVPESEAQPANGPSGDQYEQAYDNEDGANAPAEENGYPDDEAPPIMTNEDILLCYWKISCRMRVTSMCLQRWLSSWIAFVVLWCANYIIYWTSHDATIIAIVEFIIPLLMIPLLASAYAEANTEGQRMIRSICPVQERLALLFYLSQQPLQMTIFNFPVTYQGIVGVIAAFSVAFASRIVLDEVLVK
ncbi:uncharacterized protein LOC135463710 [Liolophura sinensis]|uniref:uncharacterized protein LOC135463710 n=1 Tax=Liolophura sinensis TaxID=3198878 RepID=UPI0031594B10